MDGECDGPPFAISNDLTRKAVRVCSLAAAWYVRRKAHLPRRSPAEWIATEPRSKIVRCRRHLQQRVLRISSSVDLEADIWVLQIARMMMRRPCGGAGHTTAASNKIPRPGPRVKVHIDSYSVLSRFVFNMFCHRFDGDFCIHSDSEKTRFKFAVYKFMSL